MRWALEDGVAPEAVDYIRARQRHVQNDLARPRPSSARVRGHAYRLAVNSTKSMIGHCFGAAGAVEGLATVMAVYTDTIHPTINLQSRTPAVTWIMYRTSRGSAA